MVSKNDSKNQKNISTKHLSLNQNIVPQNAQK